MKLLNVHTLQIQEYFDKIPEYAILSHTWGPDEVSFQDMLFGTAQTKAGYKKIEHTCQQALKDQIAHVWIDTCCIDKSSSSELSESINSMFRWYQKASVCYAYLSDISPDLQTWPLSGVLSKEDFARSRWFTRGWTLQELLAPSMMIFFSFDWEYIGSRDSMGADISQTTGIDRDFLNGRSFTEASIAKRMSWASRRQTTRTEDLAYCLFGIFGVNMPLLYGEGRNAFIRLQEEIMRVSDDQTIFSWGFVPPSQDDDEDHRSQYMIKIQRGLLTPRPADFAACGHLIPDQIGEARKPYTMTNMGVQMEMPLASLPQRSPNPFAILACSYDEDLLSLLALPVLKINDYQYSRLGDPFLIHRDEVVGALPKTIYLIKTSFASAHSTFFESDTTPDQLIVRNVPKHGTKYSIWKVEPSDAWDPRQRVISRTSKGLSIVIRLREKHGEGAVIMLPNFTFRDFNHFRCKVFWETQAQPFKYGTSEAHHMQQAHLHPELDSIRIVFGEPKRLRSRTVISTIDIDVLPIDVEGAMTRSGSGYRSWKGADIVYRRANFPQWDDLVNIEEDVEVEVGGESKGLDERPGLDIEAGARPRVIADLMLDETR